MQYSQLCGTGGTLSFFCLKIFVCLYYCLIKSCIDRHNMALCFSVFSPPFWNHAFKNVCVCDKTLRFILCRFFPPFWNRAFIDITRPCVSFSVFSPPFWNHAFIDMTRPCVWFCVGFFFFSFLKSCIDRHDKTLRLILCSFFFSFLKSCIDRHDKTLWLSVFSPSFFSWWTYR